MQQYERSNEHLEWLLGRFEEMSETGIGFMEESDYERLIDYFEERLQVEKAIEVTDLALSQHQFSSILLIRKAQLLLSVNDIDRKSVV